MENLDKVSYGNASILEIEKNNVDSIHLFRRQSFFRAYGKSAMAFVRHIRHAELCLDIFQKENAEMLFVGIHSRQLESKKVDVENLGFSWNRIDDNHVVISGIPPIEGYEEWVGENLENARFKREQMLLNKGKPNRILPSPPVNVSESVNVGGIGTNAITITITVPQQNGTSVATQDNATMIRSAMDVENMAMLTAKLCEVTERLCYVAEKLNSRAL
ncbi:MAG: hypothetical protein HUK21_07035 [Fibrobacteraceae bacterium]|nr:hypothetical protein [Fibrobacteraceae bacterium]